MTALDSVAPLPAILASPAAGVRIHNDPGVLSPLLARMIADGSYERPEIDAIAAAMTPGRRVLELGGGIGFISASVASRFAPASYDVVEANPALIGAIAANHALNGLSGVRIHNCVVTSDPGLLRAGHASLGLAETFWSSSVLPRDGQGAAVNVPAVPLATLMRTLRPEVLIADIEGGEAELFTGVWFSTLDLVILEVHQRIFGPEGMAKTFTDLARLDLVYDDFLSRGSVVVFRRYRPERSPMARLYRRSRMALERLRNRRWRHLGLDRDGAGPALP